MPTDHHTAAGEAGVGRAIAALDALPFASAEWTSERVEEAGQRMIIRRALLAAAPPPPVNFGADSPSDLWRGIDTAPTTGEPVMLFGTIEDATAPVRFIGWWLEIDQWICMGFYPNKPLVGHPTHWMPLPPMPASRGIRA